jgi:hypothetical protein
MRDAALIGQPQKLFLQSCAHTLPPEKLLKKPDVSISCFESRELLPAQIKTSGSRSDAHPRKLECGKFPSTAQADTTLRAS